MPVYQGTNPVGETTVADEPAKPGSYAALIRQVRSGRIHGSERERQQNSASAIEQSERSSEKPAVSDGSWLPKNWKEARPQIIWGVLVLGCGLELIISVLDGNFSRAFFALVGLLGFPAMLIHGEQLKQKLLNINPNWIVAAFSLFLVAIILSPFVEEKRWPLSAWFQTSGPHTVIHDPPTAEDIARAVAPIQADRDAAVRERDQLKQERDAARNQLQALQTEPHSQSPANLFKKYDLTEEEIRALADEVFQIKNELSPQIDIQRIMLDDPSNRLSYKIGRAFDYASIKANYFYSRPNTPKDQGIRIRVLNIQEIPDGAKKLAEAFKKVGLSSNFEVTTGWEGSHGNFAIFFGSQP
jgi:hypothetical protein